MSDKTATEDEVRVDVLVILPLRGKQPRGYIDPWADGWEVNDRCVCWATGKLYRLLESSGWGKAMRGELTPREIKPPQDGLIMKKINNKWCWVTAL